jgi:hypothetical protein
MKNLLLFASVFAFGFYANLTGIPKDAPALRSLLQKDNRTTLRFKETDSIFANPGQGWFNSSRFPSTDRYVRRDWVEFEPERGKYNWAPFEDAIAAGKQKGIKISVRIMTNNPHSRQYYTSPKWLFDEGCKSFDYNIGGTGDMSAGIKLLRIEPDYSDPIFLKRHGEFIKAFGEKYDGSPDIDFIDIGSYGDWGEWHSRHPVNAEVRKKIVDMYTDAFKKTQLVFLHGDEEILAYALTKGVGTRRDGIGSPWDRKDYESPKYNAIPGYTDGWKHAPVVFEWYGGYEWMTNKGWPLDSAVEFMLKHHVTFINDNLGKIPEDKISIFRKLAKYAGARLVLNEISFEKILKSDSPLNVNLKLSNTGAGKMYLPYVLRFFILDSKNNVVFNANAKSDPTSWLPGEYNLSESIRIPSTVRKGNYKFALAIVDKTGNRFPFRLAIEAPQNNGMYILGDISIK